MLRLTTSTLRASHFAAAPTKSNFLRIVPKSSFSSFANKPTKPTLFSDTTKTTLSKPTLATQYNSSLPIALTTRTYQAPSRPSITRTYEGEGSNRALGYLLAALGFAGVAGLAAYGFTQSEAAPGEGYVASRMRYTYAYMLGSLGITAGTVALLARSSIPIRIATANPLLMFCISIAGLLGTQILATGIPYDNVAPKHLAWASFCGALGAVISPVTFVGGQVISQAAAATAAIVGSLSVVGMSDPTGMFLNIGGPLSIGLGLLIGASLGSIFFPGVAALQSLVVYGGTALFGFFVLHDTQKMQLAARTQPRYDPINNCIGLVMDTVNIFMFMVNIFGNRKQR